MGNPIQVRNHVNVAGNANAPTMIFAHGFGTDQSLWRYVEPAFREDYRTVLFDYVGSGKADIQAYDAERYASIEGYASDVLDICNDLKLRDAIFVGHSFSSMVGIVAAIRAPEFFSRLILIGPSARFENDLPDYTGGFEHNDLLDLLGLMDRNMIDWANFMAPVAMKNADRPELTEELASVLNASDPDILRRFAHLVFFGDQRHYLPLCHTPALILQCTNDAIAPISAGEYIRAHLPGSILCYMRATGHCPHVSHPEETIASIGSYLATGHC